MISFNQFKQAWQAFEGDLNIVGHPNDPKMSCFAPPREWGEYNLTLLPKDLTEHEVKEKLAKIKMVGVTCMDKRVAQPFYKLIAKGYSPEEVFLLTVGGGIVQKGEERRRAMKDILAYLAENAPNLEETVISDHDHRCGAVAYWLGAEAGKLPKGFGEQAGGEQEKEVMKSLISEGYQSLVPQQWKDKGKVKVWLVSPKVEEKSLGFQPFDPHIVEVKGVKDL